MIKNIVLSIVILLMGCLEVTNGFASQTQNFPTPSNPRCNIYPAYIISHTINSWGVPTLFLRCPGNIVIDDSSNGGSYPYACTIPAATIMSALTEGNVCVQAIKANHRTNGNITVNSPITLPNNGVGDLSFNAAGDIALNAGIVLGNANSQNTNLTLNAPNGVIFDVTTISLGGYNITMNSNRISFNNGSTINAFGDLHNGGGTLTMRGNNLLLQSTKLFTQSAATTGTVLLISKGIITLNGVSICEDDSCNFILEDQTGIKKSYIGHN